MTIKPEHSSQSIIVLPNPLTQVLEYDWKVVLWVDNQSSWGAKPGWKL